MLLTTVWGWDKKNGNPLEVPRYYAAPVQSAI